MIFFTSDLSSCTSIGCAVNHLAGIIAVRDGTTLVLAEFYSTSHSMLSHQNRKISDRLGLDVSVAGETLDSVNKYTSKESRSVDDLHEPLIKSFRTSVPMSYRGIAILLIFVIVGAGAGGSYLFLPATKPDPAAAGRDDVFRYLVIGDLAAENRDYQVAMGRSRHGRIGEKAVVCDGSR